MSKSYGDVKSQFMQREYSNGATKNQANNRWHKSDAKANSNPTNNPPNNWTDSDDDICNMNNYDDSYGAALGQED